MHSSFWQIVGGTRYVESSITDVIHISDIGSLSNVGMFNMQSLTETNML